MIFFLSMVNEKLNIHIHIPPSLKSHSVFLLAYINTFCKIFIIVVLKIKLIFLVKLIKL